MSENKLESDIIAVLQTVYDPEIPVSIYDLGLIYDINIRQNKNVMTTETMPVIE